MQRSRSIADLLSRAWRGAAVLAVLAAAPGAHAQSTEPSALPPTPVFVQPGETYVDAYGRPVDAYGRPLAMGPVAPPPRPAPASMRGTIGLTASALFFADSDFRRAAPAWGYTGFTSAIVFALDGGVHLNRFVLLGARVGYAGVGGGNANYDNAALSMDMFDFDGVARLGAPVRLGSSWIFFPGAQLEIGGQWADIRLRNNSNATLMPRVAGQAIAMFASQHIGLSVRFGYQYAEWSHTDGTLNLSLSGFQIGLGLEVRL